MPRKHRGKFIKDIELAARRLTMNEATERKRILALAREGDAEGQALLWKNYRCRLVPVEG